MIRSMTAFGRGEVARDGDPIVTEVRTVNSRHLDLRFRLPRDCAALEPALRTRVARYFSRGKVDVTVRLPDNAGSPSVTVNLEAAQAYVEAAERLQERFSLEAGLSVDTVLGLPGVARLEERESTSEELVAGIEPALQAACEAAAEMREREGEAIQTELETCLSRVDGWVTKIASRADEVGEALRDRLSRRLSGLVADVGVDPARVDQEVVLYADRMDVTEEISRLRSHIAQFRDSLERSGPVGRKLEFLLQELSREANTLGSKATDGEISPWVVELKTELEKVREQVLNVE
ncbi:MAG: YicC/YloC family endoribonuclease [Myxococcota bacterium]